MKIIDGLKLKGKPAIIPGTSRNDLPEFFVEMGYKVGAEIGVNRGEFTERFGKAGLKMYAIDPWRAFTSQGRKQNIQEIQDQYYEEATRRLSKYDCTILRLPSMKALNHIARGSLDFVYIDGDHRLRAVIDDILEWSRKVRSGGVIAGHDYYCTWHGARNVICQVLPAVKACVEVLGIENYYIIDSDDKCPSWMWIKP